MLVGEGEANMERLAVERAFEPRSSAAMVLVVDDEESTRQICGNTAELIGLQVRTAATTEEAIAILDELPIDIVITDLKVPQIGGQQLLQRLRLTMPHIAVIVLTQYGSIESAIELTRMGAADYVTKPFNVGDLRIKLERAVRALQVDQENRILREQLKTRPGFGGLLGTSAKMQRVYKLIEKVSGHNYPVLILGESGTGKELVARSIHFMGPRKDKPFVPVDCSALVSTLIESELFGHVKGAVTGAQHNKQGLLETAGDGTLFLDEIGELPVDLQAKLLRALQEREIRPVGGNERMPLHARIIAATNRDLESAIRTGSFRQDLFFRLNVVTIKLPPLRERRSDIPLLVSAFLEKFSNPEKPTMTMSEDAMRRLIAYDWPGNVRELENAIERTVALSSGPALHHADLPTNVQYGHPTTPADEGELLPLDVLEKRAIIRALKETGGDKLAAARILRIGKTTLYRKLKEYEGQQEQ
jgi:DNA-binding NtrC family response regulator